MHAWYRQQNISHISAEFVRTWCAQFLLTWSFLSVNVGQGLPAQIEHSCYWYEAALFLKVMQANNML